MSLAALGIAQCEVGADVELRLRPTQRPALSLAPAEGLRLGQTTWVTPTDAREGAARLRVPAADAAPHDEVTTAA